MRTFPKIALAAAAAWLAAAAALAAQPSDPSALVPCAFALSEIAEAMGVELQHGDLADMTTPVGRDVGCLYSSKATDFVFGVRQTWDRTRPPGKPPAKAMPGHRALPGDPDASLVARTALCSFVGIPRPSTTLNSHRRGRTRPRHRMIGRIYLHPKAGMLPGRFD